jgi:hypothetical protein
MRILISPKFARKVALALFLTALVLTLLSFSAQLGLEPLSQLISARSTLNMQASRELAGALVELVNVMLVSRSLARALGARQRRRE